MYKNRTVILANGTFPKSRELLSILDNAKQIICCDGAVNKLLKSGREPSLIIGDLDSVNDDIKRQYKDCLIRVSEQNTNDLTKAVNWCVSQNISKLIVMGATGEREDHTIANIALLSKYNEETDIKMLTDNGTFIPIHKPTVFNSFIGQQVSIFSQTPEVELWSEGLKYPLQNYRLSTWWMGTLNESISDKFKLSFTRPAKLLVYLLNK